MRMGPSMKDRCVSWIAENSFARQDYEASKGVVVAPRSGGGNMGTRRQCVCQLFFLV